MKSCGTCKRIKPLALFYRQASSKDGHKSLCKECSGKAQRVYGKAHKEKLAAAHRLWCLNNAERRRERSRVTDKVWVNTHRAMVRQTKRRYKTKRKAWELNGSFTQRDWDLLVEFFLWRSLPML